MSPHGEDFINLEGMRRGDKEAFTRIYNLYWARVYGFAYRMLGTQSAAEDITHEAFLVLIQYPERYCLERGSLLTFLCAIARNRIFNHFRRLKYEAEDFFDEQELIAAEVEDEDSPLSFLLEKELAAKINESIALLPPRQREVILLREFQELSYEEISMVIGVEVNVVKARLHRARQTLAKRLAPYMNLKGENCYEL